MKQLNIKWCSPCVLQCLFYCFVLFLCRVKIAIRPNIMYSSTTFIQSKGQNGRLILNSSGPDASPELLLPGTTDKTSDVESGWQLAWGTSLWNKGQLKTLTGYTIFRASCDIASDEPPWWSGRGAPTVSVSDRLIYEAFAADPENNGKTNGQIHIRLKFDFLQALKRKMLARAAFNCTRKILQIGRNLRFWLEYNQTQQYDDGTWWQNTATKHGGRGVEEDVKHLHLLPCRTGISYYHGETQVCLYVVPPPTTPNSPKSILQSPWVTRTQKKVPMCLNCG